MCSALRKKCPYSELFWSSFRLNTDQNNFEYGHFSRSYVYEDYTQSPIFFCKLSNNFQSIVCCRKPTAGFFSPLENTILLTCFKIFFCIALSFIFTLKTAFIYFVFIYAFILTLPWFFFLQKQSPEVFYKKAVLKDFAIFTGKYMCWCLIFIEDTRRQASNFIKKKLRHECFLVNIAKTTKKLRTPILKNICKWLLLFLSLFLVPPHTPSHLCIFEPGTLWLFILGSIHEYLIF